MQVLSHYSIMIHPPPKVCNNNRVLVTFVQVIIIILIVIVIIFTVLLFVVGFSRSKSSNARGERCSLFSFAQSDESASHPPRGRTG